MNTMLDHGYSYEIPEDNGPIIKVIGVGGAGGNAVKHMVKLGVKDVSFAVCNTDRQALMSIKDVQSRLQLGDGLGAGTEAEAGEKAARDGIDEIRNLLAPPTKMVFITAGMGGGTGTGAAPVVAEVARELKLLTVAVVTAPYWYEGTEKKEQAMAGIERLKKSCDTVLVVLNDKLAELYGDLDWTEAYGHADNVLANAVKSIAEIITTQGDINADFADVKKVLSNAGQSVMGSAEGDGDNRALDAIEAALNSPLLNDRDIRGAKRVLLTVASSKDKAMKMNELTVISKFVAEKIQVEARMVKVGAIVDKTLGTKLRVTVIAAGFDTGNNLEEFLTPNGVSAPADTESEKPDVKEENVADVVAADEPAIVPVSVDKEAENVDLKAAQPGSFPDQTLTRSVSVGPDVIMVPGRNEKPLPGHRIMEPPVEAPSVSDTEQIQRMIDDFYHNRVSERDMETPAYLRHKVSLFDMQLLPEGEVVRYRLGD
jgi:cell division protein FtsZ